MRTRQRSLIIYLFLGLILIGGGILRWGYMKEYSRQPEFLAPSIDAAYHDYWARGVGLDQWDPPPGFSNLEITRRPFFRPPGYAYLLGGIYRLADYSPWGPRVFQFLLGLATVFLGFGLGKYWFSPLVGLGWALFLSGYWLFIYFEAELLGVSLVVGLVLLLLWCLSWWRYRTGFFPGLVGGGAFGLVLLFRANVVLLVLGSIVWLWWLKSRDCRRRFFSTLLGLGLGVAIFIFPVFLRNLLVGGEPVPLAANAGMSLAIGLNSRTDGTDHFLPGYGQFGSPFDYPAAIRKLSRQEGREFSYREASAFYGRKAWDFVYSDPSGALRLLLRKTLLFWGPREVVNNREISSVRVNSAWLSLLPGGFALIFSLALAGILTWKIRSPDTPISSPQAELMVLLVGFVIVYFLSILPAAAASRYRVPVLPVLGLLGVIFLVKMVRLVSLGTWGKFSVFLGLWAVLFFLVSRDYVGYRSSGAKHHYDRAVAYTALGNIKGAEDEYRQALKIEGGYVQAAGNLGVILMDKGEIQEAIQLYRKSLLIDPAAPSLWSNLSQSLLEQGQVEEAARAALRALELDPEAIKALNNLGIIKQRQGLIMEAERLFRQALDIDPNYPEAAYNLANLEAGQGKKREAMTLYLQALSIRPDYGQAWNNLGGLWAGVGKVKKAEEAFRRALKCSDPPAGAWGNLANIRAAAGDYAGAEKLYQQALEIDEANPDILANYGYTLELAGRREEAVHFYKRAINLNPQQTAACSGLSRLKGAPP